MTAYYNEFDPNAAAWLRQLILNGDIAPGIVDDRSITEVQADDLRGFTQVHFFAGIGGWSAALRLQTGLTTDLFGQEVVPVSHSAQRVTTKARKTKDTCGRISTASLASANLTQSLVNRLKERLSTDGSMIYKQTWKEKVTPSGIVYWAHTASAHRISDKGFTGLPTPTSSTGGSNNNSKAVLERGHGMNLEGAAVLMSGWPTASARDWKDSSGMATTGINSDGSVRTRLDQLPRVAAIVATGQTRTGSTAETTSTGQLNPALSRWLMGYLESWCVAAIQANRSMPTKRKRRESCV